MASTQLTHFLDSMWMDYCKLNPQAKTIAEAFTRNGEIVANDHIALRTFNHPKLGIKSLEQHFTKYGYKECGEYFFKEKKLYAKHYENQDPTQPKIFISELELEKMSPFVQQTLSAIAEQISNEAILDEKFVYNGKYWDISYDVYEKLAAESEYASWVYAFGFRPNHFTVDINQLKNYDSLEKVNAFIKALNFKLNTSGGEIKGTPAELLEQSSTMANHIQIKFTEGTFLIPACYYEFAKRYRHAETGQFYQGFIAKSADKIFESTNRQ